MAKKNKPGNKGNGVGHWSNVMAGPARAKPTDSKQERRDRLERKGRGWE